MKKWLLSLSALLMITTGFAQKGMSGKHKEKVQANLYNEALSNVDFRMQGKLQTIQPGDAKGEYNVKKNAYAEFKYLPEICDALLDMVVSGNTSGRVAESLANGSIKNLETVLGQSGVEGELNASADSKLLGARSYWLVGNFKQADKFYKAALSSRKYDARVWKEAAWVKVILGYNTEAVNLISGQIDKANSDNDKAELYFALAAIQNAAGNRSKAIVAKQKGAQYLPSAVESLRKAGKSYDLTVALVRLGQFHASKEEYMQAREKASEALSAVNHLSSANANNKAALRAIALRLSARSKAGMGDNSGADQQFTESIEILNRLFLEDWLSYQAHLGKALVYAGISNMKSDKNDVATEQFENGLAHFEELSEKFPSAFIDSHIGALLKSGKSFESINNRKKADDAYNAALDLSRKGVAVDSKRFLPGHAKVLSHYGRFKSVVRDFDSAQAYLNEAIETLNQPGVAKTSQDLLPKVLVKLAELNTVTKAYNDAVVNYERALNLVTEQVDSGSAIFSDSFLMDLKVEYCIALFKLMSSDPKPEYKTKGLEVIANAQDRLDAEAPGAADYKEKLDNLKMLFESHR